MINRVCVVYVVISEQLLDQLLHRVPSLADVEPQALRSWTESFTPDGKYILGPAPEVRYVTCVVAVVSCIITVTEIVTIIIIVINRAAD